jgi:hypothetical protein
VNTNAPRRPTTATTTTTMITVRYRSRNDGSSYRRRVVSRRPTRRLPVGLVDGLRVDGVAGAGLDPLGVDGCLCSVKVRCSTCCSDGRDDRSSWLPGRSRGALAEG